jgi:hypothetical protein
MIPRSPFQRFNAIYSIRWQIMLYLAYERITHMQDVV